MRFILVKNHICYFLLFSILTVCYSHPINDNNPSNLHIAQTKLKTALKSSNLQISIKNILQSERWIAVDHPTPGQSVALFAMRNHQWYQLELTPSDRLFGFNMGQRFPYHALLSGNGFLGIFGRIHLASQAVNNQYYKILMPGFGIESLGVSYKWTAGVVPRFIWETGKSANTTVDLTGYFHYAIFCCKRKSKIGRINPFVSVALTKLHASAHLAPAFNYGIKWDLPSRVSLSLGGQVEAEGYNTIKNSWSVSVNWRACQEEKRKDAQLPYGLYEPPDVFLPNAFFALLKVGPAASLQPTPVIDTAPIIPLSTAVIPPSTDQEEHRIRDAVRTAISKSNFEDLLSLIEQTNGACINPPYNSPGELLVSMTKQLETTVFYGKKSLKVAHLNCFKMLLRIGSDNIYYTFFGNLEIGEMLVAQGEYLNAGKICLRYLKICPPYLAECILAGGYIQPIKYRALHQQVVRYTLKNYPINPLALNMCHNLYDTLIMSSSLSGGSARIEAKALAHLLFYKPFIQRYIEEYAIYKYQNSSFATEEEKARSLSGRWYQCVEDECATLKETVEKFRVLTEALPTSLPFEIREKIEEAFVPDELQEGMQAYLKRIQSSGVFGKKKPLPNPVFIEFLLSPKFLRPYRGKLRYQQRLSFLERRAVSLWIEYHQDRKLDLDCSSFLGECAWETDNDSD